MLWDHLIMKLLIIYSLVVLCNIAIAQDGPASLQRKGREIQLPAELEKRLGDFFEALKGGKINSAFSDLLKDSPIAKKTKELSDIKEQTSKSFEHYGKLDGAELVSFDPVTESYCRIKYLGLNSNFPTRWTFTFYKSPTLGWIVTNLKFDDLAEFLFDDE